MSDRMTQPDRIEAALRAILEAQLAASYKLSAPRGTDVRKAVREGLEALDTKPEETSHDG